MLLCDTCGAQRLQLCTCSLLWSSCCLANHVLFRLISVVGFLDSIVAAKQNAGRFGYTISPNRELVALGAGNIIGSFVPGTLPAYGSITR